MQNKRFLLYVGMVMALFLTACVQTAPAPAEPAAEQATEVEAGEPASESEEMAGDGYEIAAVTFYSDFFMQTVVAGMELAGQERGVGFSNHVSELDLEKETQIIEDLITKGVDAILITPVSADGSIAALKKAKEAGITIVCFNTCVNEEGLASSFLYTQGQEHGAQTGKAVAQYIQEEMGGSAKMGILNCETFELCVERYEGFMAELEGLDVEVVSNQLGFVADEAVTVAEDMLQAHPEIDIMWSENEGGTVGIVQAVKSMGLAGEMPVFGLDINLQLAQMLLAEDGILLGTTGQSPYELGYLTMNTAVDVLNGEEVEPVVYSPAVYFDRGNPAKTQEFIDTEGQDFFSEMESSEAGEPASESEEMAGDGYEIAAVTFYSDFFMQTVVAGMELAGQERGVGFSNHVSELDLEKETQIIEDLITKGVDAILITPVSADGSIAALKKAKEAGITIVCFNTCVNEEGLASSFLYTQGQEHGAQTGKAVAQYIQEEMGGSAKMGILNCETFELCVERYEGFMAELEGLDVEVVSNQLGFVADEAVTVAEDMLQAHPEIDIMWSENEGGTVGIVQAVKSMGLAGEMPVFGLDINLQLAQMLLAEDGILLGTTGQSPYELGYLTMNTAVDVLNGEEVDAVVYSPAVYFDRNDPAKTQEFIDSQGQAFFELK